MEDILTPEQWKVFQIQLKQKHPELADTELPYYEAEESDLLCMIKYRLQKYQEEMGQNNHVSST